MTSKFNSPPGWPTPPEGWSPPPGWQPDPSWPPAPQGWQFWTEVEDPFDAAADLAGIEGPMPTSSAPQGPTQQGPTQQGPTQQGPTQQGPTQQGPVQQHQQTPYQQTSPPGGGAASTSGSSLYSYAPSTGLEQQGADPYTVGGYGSGGQPPGGGYPPNPGGPPPKNRSTGIVIAVGVACVLVIGLIAWGVASLFNGGDSDPEVSPTQDQTGVDASPDPTTDPPTTQDPTDPPSSDPTDSPTTTDPGTWGNDEVVDLVGTEPAISSSFSGEPLVEIRLLGVEQGWQPDGNSIVCGEPENGQYVAVEFEFTTLPALADESSGTFNMLGWEVGVEVDGQMVETSGFGAGLFCLSDEDRLPEMRPNETQTGWALVDAPEGVTAIIWDDPMSLGGDPIYRWVLADQ